MSMKKLGLAFVVAFVVMATPEAMAAVTGAEFKTLYDWVKGAMTGYLGRAIALVGALIGLGIGAGKGSAVPAIVGIVLAIFAVFGPTIIEGISTAVI